MTDDLVKAVRQQLDDLRRSADELDARLSEDPGLLAEPARSNVFERATSLRRNLAAAEKQLSYPANRQALMETLAKLKENNARLTEALAILDEP